jgi:glucose/arabinose dehydrogenase
MQPHRHAAVSFRLWPCRSTPSANRPLLALVLFALLLPLTPASTDSLAPLTAPPAATLRPGFQESVVFSGLTNPTAVRFAPDGRVFVAENEGLSDLTTRGDQRPAGGHGHHRWPGSSALRGHVGGRTRSQEWVGLSPK